MLKTAALSLVVALAGCQSAAPTLGAGFGLLTPKIETVDFMIKQDRILANQIAANNRACRRAPACAK